MYHFLPRFYHMIYYQRKFRSLTSDNMESWKAEQRSRVRRWKAEKGSRVRRKKLQLRESQKQEDTHARNVRKVAIRCVFPMICGSAGSKRRLAKAAGAEPCVQGRHEKLHGAVARSAFSSQNVQNTPPSEHFWSWDVEKLHAAVAISTFQSQNVQNTPCSDHFLKLGCGKIARCCSEKHIFKSKCSKHDMLGPFFDVGLWKNGTLL